MKDHRQACQRQHRVLGHFLAMQAWLRGVECLALERLDLEMFLGLKRFKEERVRWVGADLKPWFPHQVILEQGSSGFSLHSLYLSRVPINQWLPDGKMTTDARIAAMASEAPKTEAFASPAKGKRRLKESDIVRYLALLDSGLTLPKPLSTVPIGEP